MWLLTLNAPYRRHCFKNCKIIASLIESNFICKNIIYCGCNINCKPGDEFNDNAEFITSKQQISKNYENLLLAIK